MKLDISTEARFHFSPSMAAIDLLIMLAKRHYDATCRGTAIGTTHEHGLSDDDSFGVLIKWKRVLAFYGSEGSTVPETHGVITATWRQLDILLKVMEDCMGLTAEELKVREEIRNAFILAMNAYRPKKNEWQLSIDTEADK